ncbi:hypothetical protein C900_01748 [Fulvivirga imtechensis AK7]|uniref:Uncharacterized protein n=1 Tax=Fulvivirga imtechensis AK7 TaxID=1237149 RepID=L8JX37_9BACT|nr:hypothetical protein C900_01748 [Fulvivirga imtechensis AK7]
MEYSFRNSPNEKVKKVFLNQTGLDLYVDGAKYVIPYCDINGVWLQRPGGICTPRAYSCTLNINDKKPVFISSKNYDEAGDLVEQSNHYNSFVRVLHHHLQKQGRAQYKFGVQPLQYALRVVAIIAILGGFTLSYLYLNINQYLLAVPALLSLFVAVCGLNFCIANFPKGYRPENIPLQLLPSQI